MVDGSRKRRSSSTPDDDQALVKAAAWAWYQHGFRNEDKPAIEFGLARSRTREPRPTRFKLEAIRSSSSPTASSYDALSDKSMSETTTSCTSSSPTSPLSLSGVPLLDSYEIERIRRHLDCLTVSTRSVFRRGRKEGDLLSLTEAVRIGGGKAGGRRRQKVGGVWVKYTMGICRSTGDVVEGRTAVERRRPRQPWSCR